MSAMGKFIAGTGALAALVRPKGHTGLGAGTVCRNRRRPAPNHSHRDIRRGVQPWSYQPNQQR